jgi:hypothetical protein
MNWRLSEGQNYKIDTKNMGYLSDLGATMDFLNRTSTHVANK